MVWYLIYFSTGQECRQPSDPDNGSLDCRNFGNGKFCTINCNQSKKTFKFMFGFFVSCEGNEVPDCVGKHRLNLSHNLLRYNASLSQSSRVKVTGYPLSLVTFYTVFVCLRSYFKKDFSSLLGQWKGFHLFFNFLGLIFCDHLMTFHFHFLGELKSNLMPKR